MRILMTIAAAVLLFPPTDSARGAEGKQDIVDTAVSAGSFGTLATALKAANLVETLKGDGPFTVFAPTDAAFKALPEGTVHELLKPENKKKLASVLTYHVVPGASPAADVTKVKGLTTVNGQRVDIAVDAGKVKVDDATVVSADIHCSNGVIHVIDRVILPASDDIPTTAKKAEAFSTLLAAAKQAGLAEALAGEGPFTVFAPTDQAFEKLPAGTVESLLKPENKDRLASILKHHVVSGRVYSDAAVKAGKAETLNGDSLTIAKAKDGAKVGNARLLSTDIDASNGVIHVIDTVLLPKGGTQASSQVPSALHVSAQASCPAAGH
ncbi:Immunogenic protein MPT70 precursor [Posidoniimonas corsicana]|uniref:Immunogenic protein MPT70 n=1 Tax=Posidoniimonas corsicana TaxID=1938618 RepID=A0A5C5VD88_9BACT|nr:Immunogenic protein MPT70 precursor [Posidoniimonas corsicana]